MSGSVAVAEASARDDDAVRPASSRTRWLQWALLAAPVVVIIVAGWQRRWVEEDAFLNFRVVDQIRAGHGPVFNAGERVEVFTSTLWLAVLVAGRTALAFAKLEHVSIVLGLVLTGAGVWTAARGAMALWRRPAAGGRSEPRPPARSDFFVPLGVVVVVALPASWDWATSGLENGLSLAWLGALMLLVGRVARQDAPPRSVPRALAAGALVGLGPLVRPDLAVVTVVVAVAYVWARRPGPVELISFASGLLALPVLYEVFRAGYYGTLVPNTALAKDSGGTYWSQGWNYLVDLVAPYWLWLPLAVLVAGVVLVAREAAPRPGLVAFLALPVGGVLHGSFIVESGGDYLHARLLLPSLFAVAAPFAVVPWRPRLRPLVVVVAVWAVVAAAFLRPVVGRAVIPTTQYGVAEGRTLMSHLTDPGRRPVLATDFEFDDGPRARRLQARGARALVTTEGRPLLGATHERTVLVSHASGVSGYLAGPDVHVQEVNSLADAVGSRMPPMANSGAGHRKRLSWVWILALTTREGVERGLDLGALEGKVTFPSPPVDEAEVAAARRALDCGALAALVDAARRPLTAGRFWSNLTGSIGRTRLVVPRDPFVAERRFCR